MIIVKEYIPVKVKREIDEFDIYSLSNLTGEEVFTCRTCKLTYTVKMDKFTLDQVTDRLTVSVMNTDKGVCTTYQYYYRTNNSYWVSCVSV